MKTCGDCFYGTIVGEGVIMCRRYPPQVTKVEGANVTSHNPLIAESWWCGEWKQRVNGNTIRNAYDTDKPLRRKK